jgi:dipeptidyl aminopeptidase/acylaminoacyl peptidase
MPASPVVSVQTRRAVSSPANCAEVAGCNLAARDGRFLLFTQADVNVAGDLWVVPMENNQKPFALTQTRFDERDARFSPDGRHFVYSSDESGRREIYVNSFPVPEEKRRSRREVGRSRNGVPTAGRFTTSPRIGSSRKWC